MHRLVRSASDTVEICSFTQKWSRHLEQHAFMHMETHGFDTEYMFESFENNGLVGFTWTGEIIELAKTVLTAILPWGKLVDALVLVLKVVSELIDCCVDSDSMTRKYKNV
ncbi:hypothetical protein B9Z55_009294 [Caenorhabditis nigoni]|uniref:Uncharacterized protein n=1 Tax=Caenorhabditis nigoni TaxID=1611254 RepID=A0A2G5URP0_9PELO|nr:hypothetical protein B9Z55_009294 [Caenorhabditis nigoni]